MSTDVSQLQGVSQILHLIHHRNRNQHRHSHWWKWLAMLKRSIARLITEIVQGNVERASVRMKYMNDLLLPRCYGVFTQIVNDNQFSALGLTLVAELARIQRIIGLEYGAAGESGNLNVRPASDRHRSLPETFEDLGQAVAKPVTSSSNVEVGPYFPAAGDLPELLDSGDGRGALGGPETGVVVVGPEPRLREESKEASAAKEKTISKKPAKRQKRKSTNIIDDLFQGLE